MVHFKAHCIYSSLQIVVEDFPGCGGWKKKGLPKKVNVVLCSQV